VNVVVAHLRSLCAHGAWADQRLLGALQGAGRPVPDALREMAHLRGAQETWLSRIEGRKATLPVWPDLALDALATEGARLDAALASHCEALRPESLDRIVAYTNSAGDAFRTPLAEILLHLFLHGQYHRGKVNAAFRAAGAAPAGVDYITWQRETT
jgi:uncharacterized damage-inducible protein DinB